MIILLAIAGCGQLAGNGQSTASNEPRRTTPSGNPGESLPALGEVGPDGVVVHARAVMDIGTGPAKAVPTHALLATLSLSGSQPISANYAASSKITVDNSLFLVPSVITEAVLSFGKLSISNLSDNSLKVCGISGNQRCTNALIRVYTKDAAGEGLWNLDEGYGIPILVGLSGGTSSSVGLNASGATVLQTVAIPNNQHTMKETDFNPAPSYDVNVDFRLAGSGTFATTLVIEYALSL